MLASCTSIYDIEFDKKNKFNEFIQMIKHNNIDGIISTLILNEFRTKNFGNGQESASEAFTLLLNHINNSELNSLFTSRYRYIVKCNKCNYITPEVSDHSFIINIFNSNALAENNILNQIGFLEDYKCDNCKQNGCFKQSKLTMLSEILIFSFNVYYEKKIHYFPNTLIFPGKNGIKLTYKLISQIEHSGSLSGGHYWSRVLRKDGVYLCNDNSYSKSSFSPTEGTYLVCYHLV
jgi:ubiquitin C-terminal hydrolase